MSTYSATCQCYLDLLTAQFVSIVLILLTVPHVSIVWIYWKYHRIYWQYHTSAMSGSTDRTTCQHCLDLLTVPHVSIVWIYRQYLVYEGLLFLVVTLAFLLQLGLELLSDLHLETKCRLSSLAILSSIWSVQLCYLSVINPTINLTQWQLAYIHTLVSNINKSYQLFYEFDPTNETREVQYFAFKYHIHFHRYISVDFYKRL